MGVEFGCTSILPLFHLSVAQKCERLRLIKHHSVVNAERFQCSSPVKPVKWHARPDQLRRFARHQELSLLPDKSFYSAIVNAGALGSQMSKGVKISRKIWITVWAVAVLVTMVGGIGPAESWRFNIQLPGVMVALLLMSVTGPFALLFGASGGVFIAAVTILTNGLVYAALILLVLVVVKASKREP